MKTVSDPDRDVGRVEQAGRFDPADDRDAQFGEPAFDRHDFGPPFELRGPRDDRPLRQDDRAVGDQRLGRRLADGLHLVHGDAAVAQRSHQHHMLLPRAVGDRARARP